MRHRVLPAISLAALAIVLLAVSPATGATTFTVSSADDVDDTACDSSHCSLREALSAANAAPGADVIAFSIAGAGPHTIQPTSALPPVTDPVVIDGTTEPDFTSCGDAMPIEIDGSLAGASANGLWLASPSTVRGLTVNRFTGSGRAGIRAADAGVRVECSFIGTDPGGTLDLGNTLGVFVTAAATIGGSDAGDGNVISGNTQGVYVSAGGGGATIRGNRIGTDRTGTADLGNSFEGIFLDGAGGVAIGGAAAGEGNLVSGNDTDGLRIHGPSNLVAGNLIGTAASGTAALGNGQMGVRIASTGASDNNTVGGTSAGSRNVIAFNGSTGVFVQDRTGNRILGNSIFANGSLGIDLGGGPVTPNDEDDVDTGANTLQNFPVLASADSNGSSTSIEGSLNSTPSTTFRLEFFASATCDPLGHGEGATYLGSHDVTTDAGGDVSFDVSLATGTSVGAQVTATATTEPGGNTSEFSACRAVSAGTSTGTIVVVKDAQPNDAQDFSFTTGGGLSPASFSLDDDSDGTLSNQQSFTVAAGSGYSVSEQPAGGWALAGATCSDGSPVSDIAVSAGETVTCTFVNQPTAALSWVVNTASDTDDGSCSTAHCSLREAINRANGLPGADSISFDIPGSAPHTIQLATGLPAITEPATLDATTEPGYAGSPVIEIDGSTIRCGPANSRTQCGASGFAIQANPNTFSNVAIRGFAISGFATAAGKVCVGDCDLVPFPGGHGILIASGHGNVVEGNYVGTDVTGTQAKPNQGAGIVVQTNNNRIGGSAQGQGNVIAANGTSPYVEAGITLRSVYDNVVQGNRIGTGPTGTEALGNSGAGVVVTSAVDAYRNRIGGSAAGAANTIANNTIGVLVSGSGPQRGAISANAIFANSELGIDLGGDGVTANDANDADTGPNGLQNYPVLTSARASAGSLAVTGTFNGVASRTYTIELFSNPSCDQPSGHGEGRTYLGSGTVETDATGNSTPSPFTITLPVTVDVGDAVTATATDPDGNTSEFSACVASEEAGGVVYPPLDPPLPPRAGVWSWGYGFGGQLGTGSHATRHLPGAVSGLAAADELTAGAQFGLALEGDGTVESWGRNHYGQLGVDPSATSCSPYGSASAYTYTTPCRELPAPVPGLTDVASVDAGWVHSLAVQDDGDVLGWGHNGSGQLGVEPDDTSCTWSETYGSTTYTQTQPCRPAPQQLAGLAGIVGVSAGGAHSLAVDAAGNVYSWGSNGNGELGVDPQTTSCTVTYTYAATSYSYTSTCRPQPEQVAGLSGIVAVAAGSGFSLALGADGTVYAWGANHAGQLGVDPSTSSCDRTYAWGEGDEWTYTFPCRFAPEAVPGLTGVASIAAGQGHAAAVASDGSVYTWGQNYLGALGAEPSSTLCTSTYSYGSASYGPYTYSSTQPCRASAAPVAGLAGIVEVDAGSYHTLARDGAGDVFGWGSNWSGELGEDPWATSCEQTWVYGTSTYTYTYSGCRSTPERVAGISASATIAAGYAASFAAGTASPNFGVKSFTSTVTAGTIVSSDSERDGATADDQVEVSVLSPNAGEVSVSKSPEQTWVGDFNVLGRTIEIEAPDASSADEPIVLTFVVDVSLFATSNDVAWLGVWRNGLYVQNCTGAGATPDPCVASRTRLGDGDVEVVVRTTDASEWTLGASGPTADAGGPYVVDEGSTVELDASGSTGGQTPLSFLWSATAGLDDVGSATPSLNAVDNGTVTVDLTVVDSIGLADTDVAEVVVANVSPTATFTHDGPVEAGQPFRLRLASPQDPSPVDTSAGFEYAFDCGDGAGYGPFGAANERTCPTSAAGSRTVRGKIRDKDNGVSQYTASLTVSPAGGPCAGSPPPGAIVRGPGNDKINGTAGNDVIYDAGGTNTVNGAGGHDLICTGPGPDTVNGGDGDDVIVDAGGNNSVKGGGGNDRITTGAGTDTVDGGSGDDTISSGGGNDTIVGGAGNDSIGGGTGGDKITSGDGNDTVDAGEGNNDVVAGAGNDDIEAGSGDDKIDGGLGFDTCRPGGGTNAVRNCEA